MNQTYQSIDELLQWFREAPRTYGWDAMLAFDQATVNTLLLQQYIDRFNSDSYLPPVNESRQDGYGTLTELSNYVFDKPRLSFENADLQSPTATLRIQSLGGVMYTWDVSGATRKLTSITYESPVNGSNYEIVVKLTSKNVGIRGQKVIINVAEGEEPVLKFGAPHSVQKQMGATLAAAFGVNPPEIKEYVLSELKAEEGSLFEPEHVLLLTQSAPEGRTRGAAQYGDGAVLVFVAMKDGSVGSRPVPQDPHWRYLLDPKEGGHSAILVLSNEWLITKLAYNTVFLQNDSSTSAKIINTNIQLRADGPWKKLEALSGNIDCKWAIRNQGFGPNLSMSAILDLSSPVVNAPLTLRQSASGLDYDVKACGMAYAKVTYPDTGGGTDFYDDIELAFSVKLTFGFEDGIVTVRTVGEGSMNGPMMDRLEKIFTGPVPLGPLLAGQQANLFKSSFLEINTAHLTNILLADDEPIRLKGSEVPGDLVMYGNLADERVGLTLNTLEVVVGTSTTFQFEASGEETVTWTLELVNGAPGKANDVGTISSSGLYTAPAITSAYTRVRLTAKRGAFITRALITVVKELATISPAIQLAVVGAGQRYYVQGGATGDWSWDISGLKGTLIEPEPGAGESFAPGTMRYIPPTAIDGTVIVEEIKIKVGSNITTSKIVVTRGSIFEVRAELNGDKDSATLKAYGTVGELSGVTFTKVVGSGVLEGNIVKSEASPVEPYIIVQANYMEAMFSYTMLPLPFSILDGTDSLTLLQNPSISITELLDKERAALCSAMTTSITNSVSPRTRLARHKRLMSSMGQGTTEGIILEIDSRYFVDPNLADENNDRTLIRAQWDAGLEVTTTWSNAGLLPPVLRVEIAYGQQDSSYIEIETFSVPQGTTTHPYTVQKEKLAREGDAYIRVGVSINAANFSYSEPFKVRLDSIAPYEGSGIEYPSAPRPSLALITEAELVTDVSIVVPAYTDQQSGDAVYVWMEKDPPDAGTQLPPLVPRTLTVSGDTTITVPADVIRAKGDGIYFVSYLLMDKAGNRSALSATAQVTLVLGTLPDVLQAPSVPAADPTIDRKDADAKDGVYVDVPEMPDWKPGDEVRVLFGDQALAAYTLNSGAYQAFIDVPTETLLQVFGSDTAAKTVSVTYTIARLNWASAPSPATSVEIDLRKAGPENPGWPDPINADLPPLLVTSSSGSENEIPSADVGEEATLAFTVYPDAQEKDMVEFFWGTTPLLTYELEAKDKVGNKLDFLIPWEIIQKYLGSTQVPVFYRIRLPGAPLENYQQAPDTQVDVSDLPLVLPPVEFPNAQVIGDYLMLACEHLVPDATNKPCIAIAIPDLSQPPFSQTVGSVVTLMWKGFSGTTMSGGTLTPIPADKGGEFIESYTLVGADLTGDGFIWFVPYEPYCAVTYRYDGSASAEGMVQVGYSININGNDVPAPVPDNVICAFYEPGAACSSTARLAGCADCRVG